MVTFAITGLATLAFWLLALFAPAAAVIAVPLYVLLVVPLTVRWCVIRSRSYRGAE
jgi:hypothetical protein